RSGQGVTVGDRRCSLWYVAGIHPVDDLFGCFLGSFGLDGGTIGAIDPLLIVLHITQDIGQSVPKLEAAGLQPAEAERLDARLLRLVQGVAEFLYGLGRFVDTGFLQQVLVVEDTQDRERTRYSVETACIELGGLLIRGHRAQAGLGEPFVPPVCLLVRVGYVAQSRR